MAGDPDRRTHRLRRPAKIAKKVGASKKASKPAAAKVVKIAKKAVEPAIEAKAEPTGKAREGRARARSLCA